MRRAVLFLALTLVLAACGTTNQTTTPGTTSGPAGSTPGTGGSVPTAATDVIVGDVSSLTGSGAPYGIGQQRGIALAAESAGRGTRVISVDDTSTPDGGRAAMRSLVDQHASAVLGPTLSPVAAEADQVAQTAKVPVLAVTNTTLDINAIGDMVWRVTLSEDAMIPQAIAGAQRTTPFTKAVLVWDESDDYARGAAKAFREGARRNGVTLVGDVALAKEASAVDVLRTATAQGEPQAVFFAARSQRAIDLLKAAREVQPSLVKVGGNGFNAPEVITAAGAAAEGLIVAASWNAAIDVAANRAFVDAYRAKHGAAPDAFAAQGYAGVQVLLAAAAKGGGASPAQVLAGLRDMGEIDTVLGRLHFENREAVYPAAVQVVRDGAFVLSS